MRKGRRVVLVEEVVGVTEINMNDLFGVNFIGGMCILRALYLVGTGEYLGI